MNNQRQPLTPQQAMNRAAALCARSEQAPHDIREKLLKWGLSAPDASHVLQDLIKQGFLVEERYARAYVKDKFAFNGWGKIKIAHQLKLKGIATEIINGAMATIDDDSYRQRLVELLRAKWASVKNREPRAAWAAMMRFAASRGFEASLASDCVQEVTQDNAQDD